MNDKLIRFAPIPGEIITMRAVAWRSDPPTAEEVRACQWWWYRTRDGSTTIGPSLISLDIDDGQIWIAETDGQLFIPDDWGTEWTPCLPPEQSEDEP
jgi:hypothetical protein